MISQKEAETIKVDDQLTWMGDHKDDPIIGTVVEVDYMNIKIKWKDGVCSIFRKKTINDYGDIRLGVHSKK